MISDARRTRGRLRRAMALPLLALSLLLAGCAGDEESPLDAAPTASTQPSEDVADPEADALAAWEGYWDVVVRAQNTGDADGTARDRLAEVAASDIIEFQLSTLERYQGYGLKRVGEPEFDEVEVEVQGDSATVTACVNEDDWGAEVEGEPVDSEPRGFTPRGARIENQDDAWIITELFEPKDVTC